MVSILGEPGVAPVLESWGGRLTGAAHRGRKGAAVGASVLLGLVASRMCELHGSSGHSGRQPDLKRFCTRGLSAGSRGPSSERLMGKGLETECKVVTGSTMERTPPTKGMVQGSGPWGRGVSSKTHTWAP